MTDKFIRIRNLSKNPNADQVNESIKDTLYDLAIYSMIAMCLWDEEASFLPGERGVEYTAQRRTH